MTVRTPFPPPSPAALSLSSAIRPHAGEFLHARWRSLYGESLEAAGIQGDDLAQCFVHQTHRGQVEGLLADLRIPASRLDNVVCRYGNMGTPTFAVALARRFAGLRPGEKYLMQAVGGGISWCAIVAEHR
jgi:3-oxoacyl-[acyl-carrier-protein] synthase III